MGKKLIEISVIATIPDDNEEIGHDAMVATREPTQLVVEALKTLGLADAKQERRLARVIGPREAKPKIPPSPPAEPPAVVAVAPPPDPPEANGAAKDDLMPPTPAFLDPKPAPVLGRRRGAGDAV